eukprot:GHVH01010921.1.p1 GENE.GHVH01010921.1~~GHVH01010921.1.p1  ORF type:complete len:1510 (-),score=210.14 GHVH01010921.1:13-4122(-)
MSYHEDQIHPFTLIDHGTDKLSHPMSTEREELSPTTADHTRASSTDSIISVGVESRDLLIRLYWTMVEYWLSFMLLYILATTPHFHFDAVLPCETLSQMTNLLQFSRCKRGESHQDFRPLSIVGRSDISIMDIYASLKHYWTADDHSFFTNYPSLTFTRGPRLPFGQARSVRSDSLVGGDMDLLLLDTQSESHKRKADSFEGVNPNKLSKLWRRIGSRRHDSEFHKGNITFRIHAGVQTEIAEEKRQLRKFALDNFEESVLRYNQEDTSCHDSLSRSSCVSYKPVAEKPLSRRFPSCYPSNSRSGRNQTPFDFARGSPPLKSSAILIHMLSNYYTSEPIRTDATKQKVVSRADLDNIALHFDATHAIMIDDTSPPKFPTFMNRFHAIREPFNSRTDRPVNTISRAILLPFQGFIIVRHPRIFGSPLQGETRSDPKLRTRGYAMPPLRFTSQSEHCLSLPDKSAHNSSRSISSIHPNWSLQFEKCTIDASEMRFIGYNDLITVSPSDVIQTMWVPQFLGHSLAPNVHSWAKGHLVPNCSRIPSVISLGNMECVSSLLQLDTEFKRGLASFSIGGGMPSNLVETPQALGSYLPFIDQDVKGNFIATMRSSSPFQSKGVQFVPELICAWVVVVIVLIVLDWQGCYDDISVVIFVKLAIALFGPFNICIVHLVFKMRGVHLPCFTKESTDAGLVRSYKQPRVLVYCYWYFSLFCSSLILITIDSFLVNPITTPLALLPFVTVYNLLNWSRSLKRKLIGGIFVFSLVLFPIVHQMFCVFSMSNMFSSLIADYAICMDGVELRSLFDEVTVTKRGVCQACFGIWNRHYINSSADDRLHDISQHCPDEHPILPDNCIESVDQLYIIRDILTIEEGREKNMILLMLMILSICGMQLLNYVLNDRRRQEIYIQSNHCQAVQKKQLDVLQLLLPPFVIGEVLHASGDCEVQDALIAERLSGIVQKASFERFSQTCCDIDMCTVVFAEILNFPRLVTDLEPNLIVKILHDIFSGFDNILDRWHVIKIETVFQTYLFCSTANKALRNMWYDQVDYSESDEGTQWPMSPPTDIVDEYLDLMVFFLQHDYRPTSKQLLTTIKSCKSFTKINSSIINAFPHISEFVRDKCDITSLSNRRKSLIDDNKFNELQQQLNQSGFQSDSDSSFDDKDDVRSYIHHSNGFGGHHNQQCSQGADVVRGDSISSRLLPPEEEIKMLILSDRDHTNLRNFCLKFADMQRLSSIELSAILALRSAIDMIMFTQDLSTSVRDPLNHREFKEYNLRIRVGINSGPLVSGMVGFNKPQFALFGDTVNLAARMKAASRVNQINISSSAFHLLQNYSQLYQLYWTPFQKDMKGKDMQWCYLLSKRDIVKKVTGLHNNRS